MSKVLLVFVFLALFASADTSFYLLAQIFTSMFIEQRLARSDFLSTCVSM